MAVSMLPVRITDAEIARLDEWQEHALDAISHVADPESAERLLAEVKAVGEAVRLARVSMEQEVAWSRVRLLAERKWGELLGAPEPGGNSSRVTGGHTDPADRKARERARAVASVPEDLFAQYIEAQVRLTRAGLLRAAQRYAPLMSSVSGNWSTPQALFDVLDGEFAFDLDVCASAENTKCARYYDKTLDGLAQPWTGSCWMNPPYGAGIGEWVAKASQAAASGATVVGLVPARVDTGWWWQHCRQWEVRFLRGRLTFGGAANSAPFPSAVIVFGRPASVVWWDPRVP